MGAGCEALTIADDAGGRAAAPGTAATPCAAQPNFALIAAAAPPRGVPASALAAAAGVTQYIASEVQATDFLHEIQGRGVQQQVQTVIDDAWDEHNDSGE